ncbi:flagellar P-ring protein precursor FlgI [Geoalkalibacter ferrihydriticus]|uniref:Flagellar P-ring protein n=2 Tax=Geoalkalibacter ferrihydriticus TaxID=392333 RepID=A0A0C2HXQ2_9BACT|nr:flagellar basal body P-ring protein FlgI [Geoalkalibacter ferrihydriticus]KIH77547.1 flagellar basal body P-ring biosynthesis protein FlgA [Geoalkalibacter ferrihydriticus DSM 17813]SDL67420.1 flagellar P-ring protein precursor FlgI [Geoalkalibacter ferrihydriticus]
MKRFSYVAYILLVLCLCLAPSLSQATRIKDIARLEGVRDNQLVGYGLVVGLNGTGDSQSTQFTVQSLVSMMERLGVSVDRRQVRVDNVAAVMVTAQLPPFAKAGGTIDVLVSSIGDADSLLGGTLLMTPLNGPDGSVYAVAQGPLVVGALAFGGKAATVQKNHPTVGRIPGGALVEREVPLALGAGDILTYRIQNPDFTTISRMSRSINQRFGEGVAAAVDGGSVRVRLPASYSGRLIEFIAAMEELSVTPDTVARVVINEKTGTIVMGDNVRIQRVAVSHGNLNLVISESAQVSQPGPFSEGETVVVPQTGIEVLEEQGNLVVVEPGVSLGDIARALNAIGATPRDLIAIFQAIKASGSLHAELVIL